jgi:hypothetical protein
MMPSLRDLGLAVRTPSDRKLLLALRGVGPESEAESVRFHGRRVTKVGPEVKDGLFRVAGRARNPKKLPLEGWGPLNKGCERRTRALPRPLAYVLVPMIVGPLSLPSDFEIV